ncbi:MAG: putative kinase YjjJ, partial [Pseudomonadota bacterium]
DYLNPWPWPVEDGMCDGWYEGLPYPLLDMRPQGFIGRHFARRHALDLHLPDNPDLWNDDEVTYALSVKGHDQPGDLILGEASYRRLLAARQAGLSTLEDSELAQAYPALAQQALEHGVAGSSAGGEFPKFTASRRHSDGSRFEAIVKFSGADGSAAVQRWSDLLVCEHLALLTVAEALGCEAAQSRIMQLSGRTFLEVRRFDRHGEFGRSGVCTLASLNAALLGLGPGAWPRVARALQARRWLQDEDVSRIERIWWFGKWIANNDMHEGNLAFRPGLQLAPVYDMLPMGYAPLRGGELPPRRYQPELPLPEETEAWRQAGQAAVIYWQRCAEEPRISTDFRRICAGNAGIARQTLESL